MRPVDGEWKVVLSCSQGRGKEKGGQVSKRDESCQCPRVILEVVSSSRGRARGLMPGGCRRREGWGGRGLPFWEEGSQKKRPKAEL